MIYLKHRFAINVHIFIITTKTHFYEIERHHFFILQEENGGFAASHKCPPVILLVNDGGKRGVRSIEIIPNILDSWELGVTVPFYP